MYGKKKYGNFDSQKRDLCMLLFLAIMCFSLFIALLFNLDSQNVDKPDKVYCAVPTLYDEENKARWKVILNTWGRYCDKIGFFIDKQASQAPDSMSSYLNKADIIPLDTRHPIDCDGKPCRNLWEKVWRMYKHLADNNLDQYDWFVKVDTDSYFFVNFLKSYVQKHEWKSHDPHYFGHVLRHEPDRHMVAGAGIVLSREALRRFHPLLNNMRAGNGGKCIDQENRVEEARLRDCLMIVGVEASDAYDDEKRENFMIFQASNHLSMQYHNISHWYWTNSHTQMDGEDCCSREPIIIHGYKSSDSLQNIHDYMNLKTDYLKYETRRGNAYFKQVRVNYEKTYK